MNSVIEKEYALLKEETSEIKNCITRYIGYILSLAGLAGFLPRILLFTLNQSGTEAEKLDYSIIFSITTSVSLLFITLLFEVLWYKFKSHNRHVGYIQLLSQETKYQLITRLSNLDIKNKKYLKNWKDVSQKDVFPYNFKSWEFVMSRFNQADGRSSLKKILKSTRKSKFAFSFPQDMTKADFDNNFKNLDSCFFKDIIFELYGTSSKLSFKNWLLKPFRNILYLYSPIRKAWILNGAGSIDKNYISPGWQYPKKLLQLIFVPIFLLVLLSFGDKTGLPYDICDISVLKIG